MIEINKGLMKYINMYFSCYLYFYMKQYLALILMLESAMYIAEIREHALLFILQIITNHSHQP